MKRFFVFTLTVLFATSCLFLTNLTAEYDSESGYKEGSLDFVWGSSHVGTWFEFPHAKSGHQAAVYNESGRD